MRLHTLVDYYSYKQLVFIMRNVCEKFQSMFPYGVVKVCRDIIEKGLGEDMDIERRTAIQDTAYAIDGEDTSCRDDAITYDSRSGFIMVHITDVARVFDNQVDNAAVQEAFQRGTERWTCCVRRKNCEERGGVCRAR